MNKAGSGKGHQGVEDVTQRNAPDTDSFVTHTWESDWEKGLGTQHPFSADRGMKPFFSMGSALWPWEWWMKLNSSLGLELLGARRELCHPWW